MNSLAFLNFSSINVDFMNSLAFFFGHTLCSLSMFRGLIVFRTSTVLINNSMIQLVFK